MDELKATVDTLINLDEPEALLASIRDVARRKNDKRWQVTAAVLDDALAKLHGAFDPAGPDFRPDSEEKSG